MLTGVAVAIAFRAGVLNIGAEGQLLAGAAAGAAVALTLGGLPAAIVVVLALAASAVGGAGWASLAAFLRSRFAVLEVISTIMLNFVALYAVSYLVRGPLQEPTHVYPQSSTIGDAIHLPRIVGAENAVFRTCDENARLNRMNCQRKNRPSFCCLYARPVQSCIDTRVNSAVTCRIAG